MGNEKKILPLIYSRGERKNGNWGDIVSGVIGTWLSGLPVERVYYGAEDLRELYTATGSILQWIKAENVHVWGIGFIGDNLSLSIKITKVHGVRGPLTRANLLKLGVDCPEVYGDPALLLPLLYKPDIKKKYKLGIVPHYADFKDPVLDNFREQDDILVIDITKRGGGDYTRFLNEILSCDKIVSTSLHGLIAADAYGVPAVWGKISDKIVGDGFKFQDYQQSVGRGSLGPLILSEDVSRRDIFSSFKPYKVKIDLNKLLEACPYNYEGITVSGH